MQTNTNWFYSQDGPFKTLFLTGCQMRKEGLKVCLSKQFIFQSNVFQIIYVVDISCSNAFHLAPVKCGGCDHRYIVDNIMIQEINKSGIQCVEHLYSTRIVNNYECKLSSSVSFHSYAHTLMRFRTTVRCAAFISIGGIVCLHRPSDHC